MEKRKDNYSVFVGHMLPSTTKEDLNEVFKACGKIVEVFILRSEDTTYSYGFVRFEEKSSAIQAVKELNKWPMNGVPMIVDLSRETKARIENEDELEGKENAMSRTPREKTDKIREKSSHFIEDVINLSRFEECCTRVNMRSIETDGKAKVNAERLLDDISQLDYCPAPNMMSEIVDYQPIDLHNLTKKLLTRKYGVTEQCLSERDTKEFFLALEVIMDSINSFTAFCNHGRRLASSDRTEQKNSSIPKTPGDIVEEATVPNPNSEENCLVQDVNELNIFQNSDGTESIQEQQTEEQQYSSLANIYKEPKNVKMCDVETEEEDSELKHKTLENKLKKLLLRNSNCKLSASDGDIKRTRSSKSMIGSLIPDSSKNIEGDDSHFILKNKSLNLLCNTDSDSDDSDFYGDNHKQTNNGDKITSLQRISQKTPNLTVEFPNTNSTDFISDSPPSTKITSLRQLLPSNQSGSDSESFDGHRKNNAQKSLLGHAPGVDALQTRNSKPGLLGSGNGILGPAPQLLFGPAQSSHQSLRLLTSVKQNQNLNNINYNPGILGLAPSQKPMFRNGSMPASQSSWNNFVSAPHTERKVNSSNTSPRTDINVLPSNQTSWKPNSSSVSPQHSDNSSSSRSPILNDSLMSLRDIGNNDKSDASLVQSVAHRKSTPRSFSIGRGRGFLFQS